MKEVTLYTTQKKQVLSYDMENIRQYDRTYPFSWQRVDTEFIPKDSIKEINLPIQRFCWQTSAGYKEVYAAFDRELLELIGCSQDKFDKDVKQAVDTGVKQQYSDLLLKKSELETLQSMGRWDTVKWSFKKIWSK